MSKIGIMGGTFNPIHIAHLILAEGTFDQLNLDKILFMPSKNPPHKLHEQIVSDEHRIKMIEVAIQDNKNFELSKVEIEREGITYTAETLEELTKKYPEDEYYFILGADSLFQIDNWMSPEIIFQLSHIVAIGRDHMSEQAMADQINYLTKKYNANIHFLNIPNMDISSKLIRQNVKNRNSVRYYVPYEVEQYITKHQLYQDTE